ncbi:polysaccharide deacetylase family protein [Paenibacillus koleovorans]|uniref:polysaccharide deacetylase family protein n=1 Tax=Paenibacillus koleovorans TaxID=121608 RepID=UPI001FE4E3F3|nr:polysaccharide deacetylase family protein [Paenibacillus koleovorans]
MRMRYGWAQYGKRTKLLGGRWLLAALALSLSFSLSGCGNPHRALDLSNDLMPAPPITMTDPQVEPTAHSSHPMIQLELPELSAPVPTPSLPPIPALSLPPAAPKSNGSTQPTAASKDKKKKPAIPVQRQQQEAARKLTLAQLRAKYADIFKVNGPAQSPISHKKQVALTFDDGPDMTYTPQVLDVLKANHVKATFFLTGVRAEANPSVVKRIAGEGHAIGNHSYNHPLFTKLSLSEYQHQIDRTSTILKSQIGYMPRLIRPPYGEISEDQLIWTKSQQYLIVNWNVDSEDWKSPAADKITAMILNHTRAGSIVLQHSAGGEKQDLSGTVAALRAVIQQLKKDGYEFVTVPQLLNVAGQL